MNFRRRLFRFLAMRHDRENFTDLRTWLVIAAVLGWGITLTVHVSRGIFNHGVELHQSH